jgi:hypothetical protein
VLDTESSMLPGSMLWLDAGSMQARCRLDAGSMLYLDGGSMARCLLDASMGEDILR